MPANSTGKEAKMKLQESGEMYLETIYILSQDEREVHSVDVASEMGFSKPSVSRAVNLLKDNGYLNIDRDGTLTLTETGLEVAERIYERHRILSEVLMSLGVKKKTAVEDACRIEHVISAESFDQIKKHMTEHKDK